MPDPTRPVGVEGIQGTCPESAGPPVWFPCLGEHHAAGLCCYAGSSRSKGVTGSPAFCQPIIPPPTLITS